MIALHQNVANCQNTLTVLTQRWRIFPQDIWMGQMCMTDAGTTQDYFILPAPPVGRLPISPAYACAVRHYSVIVIKTEYSILSTYINGFKNLCILYCFDHALIPNYFRCYFSVNLFDCVPTWRSKIRSSTISIFTIFSSKHWLKSCPVQVFLIKLLKFEINCLQEH